MTDPSEDPQSYWPPDATDSPLPTAMPYQLTEEVNLPQLQWELTQAAGTEVVTAMVGPYPDDTVILWVTPPSLDPALVEQVITDHVPDPNWGVSVVQQQYRAVLDKLGEDPGSDLNSDEVKALAVGLALNSVVTSTGPLE